MKTKNYKIRIIKEHGFQYHIDNDRLFFHDPIWQFINDETKYFNIVFIDITDYTLDDLYLLLGY